ncbi:uncharacterized protein [Scyliorhinus torazame]|uniref:uncharacterized protein n=1 Tax=Scyliorhinus torazame TaxID=75743 RepID=UPI003B5C7473
MMEWLRTVCVIFGLTSLGVLLAMDMEKGNIIYVCSPNQSPRIHHLCKGDVLRCPHIRGHGIDSWKVVKVKENAGVMKQLHRSRRWEGNIIWTLPCFWNTCKFDFGCVKSGAIKVTSGCQKSVGRGYEKVKGTRERTGRMRREVQLERRLPGDTLKLVKGQTEGNPGSMNLFYQIYHRLYGQGRVVCYPNPAAVSRLFSVSPLWGTPQTVVHCQHSEPLPEQVTLPYDPGSAPLAICLPLPRDNSHSQYDRLQRWRAYIPSHFTPNRDSRSYENCFSSEGYGCLLVEVDTNITCLFPTCTDRRCHITQVSGQCVCYNTTCVPLNAGLQLLCGWANVSHITVGTRAFRIARRPEWAFQSWINWPTGGSLRNRYADCDASLHTEQGYYFLFNGTATNVLSPPFPRRIAIGTLDASEKEHLVNLEYVLRSFSKGTAHLKRGKCIFQVKAVMHMGHCVDKGGLHPVEAKAQAKKGALTPENTAELKLFLGLANYSGKFTPNLATLLASLHTLLKTHQEWTWEASQEEAFIKVKAECGNQRFANVGDAVLSRNAEDSSEAVNMECVEVSFLACVHHPGLTAIRPDTENTSLNHLNLCVPCDYAIFPPSLGQSAHSSRRLSNSPVDICIERQVAGNG